MKFFDSGYRKIHLIGIGGSGMSAIARILNAQGHSVSGSDLKTGHFEELKRLGISCYPGHAAENVLDKDLVVYSSAIPEQHIEILEARRLNMPVIHRSSALEEIMSLKHSIAVSGMHGKTSITGMVSLMMMRAGRDPSVIAGGEFNFLPKNARLGKGMWGVYEADESDGSLVQYHPSFAVISNIEAEHMDHYANLDEILSTFERFAGQVQKTLFLNADDTGCVQLIQRLKPGSFKTFGFSRESYLRAVEVECKPWQSRFRVMAQNIDLGIFCVGLPGVHQVYNALAAIAVSYHAGVDIEVIREALSLFDGAQRRFQVRGNFQGVTFIDDYAHHPTEVKATVNASRLCFQGKILGVFQPHRYSRAQYFMKEFASVFSGLDQVIVSDIYGSGEASIPGVGGYEICAEILKEGQTKACYIGDFEKIKEYVHLHFREYDAIITLGAGDITRLSSAVLDELQEEENALSSIRGKILRNEPMSRHTTFKLGGPADLWIEPADLDDLINIQTLARQWGMPVYVVGNGSNLIVKDGGIRGMVVRLSGSYFRRYRIEEDRLICGTGLSLAEVIQISSDAGLSGLENLKGIPGTVGGALHFNSGAYGTEIGEHVQSVLALNPDGSLENLDLKDLGFQYRKAAGLRGKIALEVSFHLIKTDRRSIHERVFRLKNERALRYPKLPNAGCIFKNPKDNYAGKIIDELGLKNLAAGGAQVSAQHGNFIVNTGSASAKDVIQLMEEVSKKVFEEKKIVLENEVEIIGEDEK